MATGHFTAPGHLYNYEPIITIVDVEWGLDTLQLLAWADDPSSQEIDGFIGGRTIFYRYWDESEQTEENITQLEYEVGNDSFSLSGYAQVNLHPPYPLSGGDEIGIFCDISANEDGSDMFCVGAGTIESVSIRENYSPENYILYQNYPNPFNPKTVIGYSVETNSRVSLQIYNLHGQLAEELISSSSKQDAGYHSVIWDAEKYPSGLYFYQLKVDKQVIANKQLLLLK